FERFDEVRIRTDEPGFDPVEDAVARGDHNDGKMLELGVSSQQADDIVSVQPGESYVNNGQSGGGYFSPLQGSQGFHGILIRCHLIAGAPKRDLYDLSHRR